jgi:arsenate reductase (thioredoxin)
MVDPDAVEVMKEKDIDISRQYPKPLADIPGELDVIITMGCGVECPYLPAQYREDWGIDDPVGVPVSEFRKIRDIIEENVLELAAEARSSGTREIFIKKLGERS